MCFCCKTESYCQGHTTAAKKARKMMGISVGSPFFYLLFVIFQLLHQHCMAVAGDILTPPENQSIAINSGMAEFYCRITGTSVRWNIDGMTYDPENRTDMNGLQFTELITYGPDGGHENTYDIYVQIPSTIMWNSTKIICLSARDQVAYSQPVYLTIQGGPAAPEPSLRTISSSELILEWNRPFTWVNHPIEHYVLASNSTLYFPHERTIENATMTSGSVRLAKMDSVEECEVIEFSVRANNGLADSPKGAVIGGFPIAPDESAASITETITFYEDRRPLIDLDIQLPRVCWFQEVEYTVTLTRMDLQDNDEIEATVPIKVKYWEAQAVTVRFEDNLENGAMYSVSVVFKTFAENDESVSTPVELSKTFRTGSEPPTDGAIATNSLPLSEETLIIIGAVGGGVVLVLALFIIIALMACTFQRRRSSRMPSRRRSNIQNRPLPMVTNPIYEGSPVYETVDVKLNSLERPHTPTTPTSIAPLLIESPYAVNTTIDPSYTTQSQQPFPEIPDNYTIMISAGQNKAQSSQESSPTHSDVRYGPEPGSVIVTSSDW